MYTFHLTTNEPISEGGSENIKTGLVPGESYTGAMKNLAIEFGDTLIDQVTLNYLIEDGVLLLSQEILTAISNELSKTTESEASN
mgnify:CR=1 FL=1